MSTKVLSKSYHRTYHTCNIIKGGSGVYSRMPALTLANLYYNFQQIARCYYEHESSTHHNQYTTEDPLPSSYGRAIRGTHAYLEAFSSIHQLVYEL